MKLFFATVAAALLLSASFTEAKGKGSIVPDDYAGNSFVHVGVVGHGEFTPKEEDYLAKCLKDSYKKTHGDLDLGDLTYKYQVAGHVAPHDEYALDFANVLASVGIERCDGEFMCKYTQIESWCHYCTCCYERQGKPFDFSIFFDGHYMETATATSANDTEVAVATDYHEVWESKFCKCLNAGSQIFPEFDEITHCSIIVSDTGDVLEAVKSLPTPPSLLIDVDALTAATPTTTTTDDNDAITKGKGTVVPDDYAGNSYVHVGVAGHGEFTDEEEDYLAKCLKDSYKKTHGNLDMGDLTYKYQVAGHAYDESALDFANFLALGIERCDGEFMCKYTQIESWCHYCTCCYERQGKPFDFSIFYDGHYMDRAASTSNAEDIAAAADYHELWESKFCKCLNAGSEIFPSMEDITHCSILRSSVDDVHEVVKALPTPSSLLVDSDALAAAVATTAESGFLRGSTEAEA